MRPRMLANSGYLAKVEKSSGFPYSYSIFILQDKTCGYFERFGVTMVLLNQGRLEGNSLKRRKSGALAYVALSAVTHRRHAVPQRLYQQPG